MMQLYLNVPSGSISLELSQCVCVGVCYMFVTAVRLPKHFAQRTKSTKKQRSKSTYIV